MGEREGGQSLLTLVIPTRNEEGNVARLVRELEESLSGVNYRVVFVDDSTDGTPGVIRSLSKGDSRVVLIQREEAEREGGLSTAVAAGMDAVANESEYTCVMDADLQHPPSKVREMLEAARESRADVVVASRYAKGGSYEGLSGPLRKAVSVGSKSLAQV
ncbi:MAG: glycosyltransferase, partial [Actinomycetota bacterium]|nr:glycosyltransferase [Actinomycetota bacterium]